MEKIAIFVFFCLFQFAPAFAEERHPFDLSKVPMDEGWEDTGIYSYYIEPCGKDHLFMGWDYLDGKKGFEPLKLRVRNLATGAEAVSGVEPRETQKFLGCTPDSRYLFIEKSPMKVHPPHRVEVYDTATMNVVATFPNGEGSPPFLRLMSPDGRYLLTGDKKAVIPLPDGRTVTIIPLLNRLGEVFSTAWSKDGKTVYVLQKKYDPQLLLIYNVETDRQQVVGLRFSQSNQIAVEVMVHPENGRAYIVAGVGEGFHIYSLSRLFMFDPAQLPVGTEMTEVMPKMLGDFFAFITFGPDNTLFFSPTPDPEAEEPYFAEEYAGIFVAEADGKVIRRVTKGRLDLHPVFMADGGYLIMDRENTDSNFPSLTVKTILKQRKPGPSHPKAQTNRKH